MLIRTWIVGLAAIASTIVIATALARDDGPGDDTEARPLRVMSFNIRYDTAADGDDSWPHRRDLVVDVIRRQDPDVVGLQEALHGQLRELLDAMSGFASVGVGRADGQTKGEYAAILYTKDRFDLDDREHGTFWLSETPEVPGSTSFGNQIERICTWARLVDRASGRGFYVYNVHLDHRSQRSRELSVQLLARTIRGRSRDEPFVITGDLNAAPRNPAVRALLGSFEVAGEGDGAAPTGLVDCYRAVNEPGSDEGTFNGFVGRTSGPRIDYVLADARFTTRSASIVRDRRDGRYPSDHFPVVAELGWPAEASPADAGAGVEPPAKPAPGNAKGP